MKDLYEILGLEKGATAEQIRRAYRKRAKATHPDMGGNRKEFDEVSLAHEVLSSPDRRAHYDATGDIGRDEVENTTAKLLEIVASALFEVLSCAVQANVDLGQIRFLDAMREVIGNQATKIKAAIAEHKKNRVPLEKVLARFSVEDGKPDHIGAIIRGNIGGIDTQIAIDEERLKSLDLARQYLADCKYRNDPLPAQVFVGFGQSLGGTSTSSTGAFRI